MLIRHVTVIDCTGREPYEADVRIENGIISEIGNGLADTRDAGSQVSSNEQVIDGMGKFLIPGLVNLHVHINRRHLHRGVGVFRLGAPAVENSSDEQRFIFARENAWYELSRGVTAMRDCSSVGRTASALKKAIETGLIRGPRLTVCGLGIAAVGGHETHRYPGALETTGPEEARQAAEQEITLGAEFIKVMASGGIGGMPEHEHPYKEELSLEEIRAACEAAHSHKKTVTVHAMGEGPVMTSLLAGVDGIEHGVVLSDEALHIMKERGVYYVPTASGITAVAANEERNGNTELAELISKLVVRPQRESIRKAHENGLLIGAGSDTLGSVPAELLILEECGLSRYEALQTATRNAAMILRNEDRFGTVECGKTADLVLLGADPLADLRNIEAVERVFLGGEEVTEMWLR